MKRMIFKLFGAVDRFTDQGDFEYDYGYDVAQKLLFVLTLLFLWALPWSWGQYEFAVFIFCCIFGRIVVMSNIQMKINEAIKRRGGRKRNNRFLYIPSALWKLIVLAFLVVITIRYLRSLSSLDEYLITIPGCLVMFICGFFIYGGITNLATTPSDPKRRGSAAWKEANGVEPVDYNLMNPLWRDRNGNYYQGRNFRPIPPPVHIINKNK